MNKQFKHQGGWVASFLIVGILLTLAVLGGLYYIKSNQKKLAMGEDNSSTSQVTTVEPANDNENKSTEKGETVDTNTQSTSTNSQSSSSSASTSTQPQSSTQPPTNAGSSTSTAKLPATGPEDTLQNAIVLALVAFSAATYIRSREFSR